MAVLGFVVSLVGLATFGVLAPLGVVLSFAGLFKEPNGLAEAGIIIGSIGMLELFLLGLTLFGSLLSASVGG